jgi:hypothetical protein
MRNILTGGVGPESAELLVVFEVDALNRHAEGAILLNAVGGDARAEVVRDEGGMACRVD